LGDTSVIVDGDENGQQIQIQSLRHSGSCPYVGGFTDNRELPELHG